MMVTPISLQQVIEQLKTEQLLSPEMTDEIKQVLTTSAPVQSVPWVLNIFTVLGVWFTTLFLTIFMVLSLKEPTPLAISGGILVVVATILNNINNTSQKSLFINQLTLALSLTGQVLLVGGFAAEGASVIPLSLLVIVLQSILFLVYQHSVHRFLSVIAIIIAILLLLHELYLMQWIPLLIFIIAGGVVQCWLESVSRHYNVPSDIV